MVVSQRAATVVKCVECQLNIFPNANLQFSAPPSQLQQVAARSPHEDCRSGNFDRCLEHPTNADAAISLEKMRSLFLWRPELRASSPFPKRSGTDQIFERLKRSRESWEGKNLLNKHIRNSLDVEKKLGKYLWLECAHHSTGGKHFFLYWQ